MARNMTAVDVGAGSAIAVHGRFEKGSFRMAGFAAAASPAGGGLAEAYEALDLPFKASTARVAISGKDLNVRYTRVPQVPDWQLRRLMRFEVAEVGDTSGAEVASDFNLLPTPPEADGEDIVLLAMARTSLLEAHEEGLGSLGLGLECFTPAAIGLYNAYLRHGVVQDDTVLLANLGQDCVDVVILRGPDLVFARNLSGGGRLFQEAVASQLGVQPAQAARLVRDFADLRPGTSHETPNHERVSRASSAAAGQLVSLLQSAVLFCKTQVKLPSLKLDRVLLTGGTARMSGLTQVLGAGLGVPVERFDPWAVVDTSALSPEEVDALEAHRDEAVVALGLATMATDPEAYGLEIVPPALAARRDLYGRKLWLVAAAVVAVAYLGFFALTSSSRAAELQKQERVVRSQVAGKQRVDQKARELLEENERLVEEAQELQRLVGTGEQLARTVEALGQHLPSDFWLTRLEGRWGVDAELGVGDNTPRPLVLLKGSLRQGAQAPIGQYQTLVESLQAELPGARTNAAFDRDRFSIDLTTFGDPAEAPEAPDTEES
jgi:type IV pilus assembly protein PilM